MHEVIIKYAALLFSGFYIYHKALGLAMKKVTWFQCAIFSLSISVVVSLLRQHAVSASIIVMVSAFICCIRRLYKTPLNLLITTSSCSIAVAYTAFVLGSAIMAPAVLLLSNICGGAMIPNAVSLSVVGLIQFLLALLFFRLPRYRAGIPFLKEHGIDNVGAYISVSLILAISFTGANQENDLIFIIPVFFMLISGLLLLFWWRSKTTQTYIEKARVRELEELRSELRVQTDMAEDLRRQNSELSKIIHRDNKLIPAMECAVRSYLQRTTQAQSPINESGDDGKALLDELSRIAQDRKEELLCYESGSKKLPTTGFLSIDTLLTYMLKKAQSTQIEFDVSLSGSVKFLAENFISEVDLQTLLADLLENALFATRLAEPRRVLLHIGLTDQKYAIRIFDSGAAFTPETLVNIGLDRITTHDTDGGSGMGMMSTFDIMRKYKASLVIDECLDSVSYTKCVSVWFDDLGEYRLKAGNPEQIVPLINRPDLTLIIDPL